MSLLLNHGQMFRYCSRVHEFWFSQGWRLPMRKAEVNKGKEVESSSGSGYSDGP